MKERPILFSAPMVRAILGGTKTQTRRRVKPQPEWDEKWFKWDGHKPNTKYGACAGNTLGAKFWMLDSCPHGQPGDRLWCRETFCPIYPQNPHYNNGEPIEYDYAATYTHGFRLGDSLGVKKIWKPSIHMPRRASRITLEITRVRVERLHDITEADAMAEGVERTVMGDGWRRYDIDPDWEEVGVPPMATARQSYFTLWNQIHHPSTWTANPWVWVIEFKKVSEK